MHYRVRITTLALLYSFLSNKGYAWIGRYTYTTSRTTTASLTLNAIPLAQLVERENSSPNENNWQECTFLQENESYRVCIGTKGQLRPNLNNDNRSSPYYLMVILDEEDEALATIADLSYECFKQKIIVHYDGMSEFEAMVVKSGVDWFTAYTDKVGYEEIYTGLKQRIKGSSIVLAMIGGESNDAIATVEIRMLPPDGKIPFSQPWLDDLERNAVQAVPFYNYLMKENDAGAPLQPYLCNLCVDEKARSRGIGKALVHCVENIVTSGWGYDKLYLHVNPTNEPAMRLYCNEGFVDTGTRWDPIWAGGAVQIAYMAKQYN